MSKEIAIIDSKKIQELAKFETMAKEVKETLMSVEITDEKSLEQANNVVNKSKEFKKQIEQTRKSITRPIDAQKKKITDLEKKILTPINEGISFAGNKVAEYAAELKRLEAEKQKKIEEIVKRREMLSNKIDKYYNIVSNEIENASSIEDLSVVFITHVATEIIEQQESGYIQLKNIINKEENPDQLIQKLDKRRDELIVIGKEQRKSIESGEKESQKLQEIKAEQKAQQEAEKATEVDEVIADKMSESKELSEIKSAVKIRMQKKFIILDEDKIPREFLTVDDKKIRAKIIEISKSKKEWELPDSNSIPGIKVYQEATHSA